jgi:uncharacterized protein
MPEDRRLASLLGTPEGPDRVREVAHRVATIHGLAPTSAAVEAQGSIEAVTRNWRDNFAQMREAVPSVFSTESLDAAETAALRFLDGRRRLFEHRQATGRIRDGHGDLLADDIFCLPDGPRLLDALAFRDDLRYGDVLADAAFLAMDIERLGHPELAQRFLDWYREFTADNFPKSLGHHYLAYRAQVRAKVTAMRAAQVDAPDAAAASARALLAVCQRHLTLGAVRLVLVGGLPGTGKSTLADALAHACGWMIIATDEVRKEMAGVSLATSLHADPNRDHYRFDDRSAVYTECLRRAEQLLAQGESVIIDASWNSAQWRQAAADTAARSAAELVELRCVAPDAIAEARILRRRAEGPTASDADVAVAHHLRDTADPWPSAITIDTTGTREAALGAVTTALALAGPEPS